MMHPMNYARLFLLLLLGVGNEIVAQPKASAPRPNIIFILADDLGYGDLGSYGQKKIKTPHLDRMAAEGMRFTQFYAGSTVCAPSRCVLMTGLNTGHCRVRGNAGKNNPEAQTLRAGDFTVAELLKQAGYSTALIGKWGLGEAGSSGTPRRQGFDYFYGYLNQYHAHNYYPAFLWRNEERVPLANIVPGTGEYGQGWATVKKEYSHDLIAGEALKWVETNKEKPFFLYWALTTPHANNEAGRDIGNGQEVPMLEVDGKTIPAYGIYQGETWTEPNKGQAAMITRMDADIGRLFDLLKRLRLDDNTLVFFSSDNGHHKEGGNTPDFFDANGPLRGMKRDLYDGGIRVPLLVRWPGKIKGGELSEHVGYFGDLMATLAELTGTPAPKNLDSLSLVSTLLGRSVAQQQHAHLYWEFHEGGSSQAIRFGNWKAVRLKRRDTPLELFDLSRDLGEESNVAARHPEVVAKMETLLKTARAESVDWPLRDATRVTAKKTKNTDDKP